MDYQMILSQIESGTYYKVGLAYPKTPVKPYLEKDASADDSEAYAKKKREYDKDMVGFREQLQEYREAEAELMQKFADDVMSVFVDAGATKTQARKAYVFCWEHGHSLGLHEVASYADDLSDIFRS